MILGDVDNVSINYNSPEVLKMLKENRQFLVFANAGDIKLADLVSSYVRRNAKPLEKNDAFWISGTAGVQDEGCAAGCPGGIISVSEQWATRSLEELYEKNNLIAQAIVLHR